MKQCDISPNRGDREMFLPLFSIERLLLMLLLLLVFSQAKAQQKFIIKGNVKGLDSDTRIILVRYIDGKYGQEPDTVGIKDNSFELKGEVSHPVKVSLRALQSSTNKTASFYTTFFLCAGETMITRENTGPITISGNPQEHEYEIEVATLRKDLRPWTDSIARLNVKTIDFKSKDALKMAQANAETLHPEIEAAEENFIRSHSDSYVVLDMLQLEARINRHPEDFERCYMLLSDHLKNTPEGKLMGERAALAVKYNIGKPAIDFKQIDAKGNLVSLASFKGKYVLIDFWASWCGPCRTEYPYLKAAYQKFKDKGFEIVGVSLDNDKAAWLNAIKDNGFMWPELCDLKGRKNEVALAYGVTGIPESFLIDPTGNIIAKSMRGDDLIKKLGEVIKTN